MHDFHISFGIREQAGQEAEAAITNGDATPDIIPHRDYLLFIKSSVSFEWGIEWREVTDNKL